MDLIKHKYIGHLFTPQVHQKILADTQNTYMDIIYLTKDGIHDYTRCSCRNCESEREPYGEDDYTPDPDSIHVDHNNYIRDIKKGDYEAFDALFDF